MQLNITKSNWFVILTSRYESNPNATDIWSGFRKFMFLKIYALKKHLLMNYVIAFADIFWNIDRMTLSVWWENIEYSNTVSVY